MDIGATIRKYRQSIGMEQATLGQYLGVSAKTISSWEVNRTQPKMEYIEKMCQAFKCKKSDFLGDEPESLSLNHEERLIIINYRSSSEEIKKTICKILDIKRKAKGNAVITVKVPKAKYKKVAIDEILNTEKYITAASQQFNQQFINANHPKPRAVTGIKRVKRKNNS